MALLESQSNATNSLRASHAICEGSFNSMKVDYLKAVSPLIGVLEDTDAGVRAEAAESLGRLNDNRAITPLIKHLRDPEVNVRGKAGRALVEIGKPGEEALISALKDGDNTTRTGVAVVLGEIGDERSIDPRQ